MEHRTRMREPVAAAVRQIELDGVEGTADRRIERVAQRCGGLLGDAAGARLHAWKACRINLDDAEACVERHRCRVRATRPGTHDDEIEIVHTWKIGNSRWKATRVRRRSR